MRASLSALLPLAALLIPGDVPRAAHDPQGVIRAVPIALDIDRPWRRRVGALRLVRGWALSSGNVRFGGLAGLAWFDGQLTALTDEGYVIRFTPGDGDRWPALIRALPTLGTKPRKPDRDSEALALDPASGTSWVTTEHRNAVWRFAPDLARAVAAVRPRAMRRWPANGGPESLARLADGRFLVLAEDHAGDQPGTLRALLFAGDPTGGARPMAFSYRPPAGCLPTDAAPLPDGAVLVLNRCVDWRDGLAAALLRLDLVGVHRGAVRAGTEIARLARPITLDNMEALTVVPGPDGVHLWIASDDNFSVAQRTLLMEFVLEER